MMTGPSGPVFLFPYVHVIGRCGDGWPFPLQNTTKSAWMAQSFALLEMEHSDTMNCM